MRVTLRMALGSAAVMLLLAASVLAGGRHEETSTYEAKEVVDVKTVSGDLVVRVGENNKITVELEHSVRPADKYEPRFKERGSVLELSEHFYGSTNGGSYWTVTVPQNTRIRFSTASGNLSIEGLAGDIDADLASGDIDMFDCTGEFDISTASGSFDLDSCSGIFDAKTASGNIRATRCSGDFDMSVASGSISARDCRGDFDLSTASGSVRASDVIIGGRSSFSSASGSAYVTLAESSEHDLRVSSASGKAILDYDGHPIKGHFEFVARERKGRIDSPFDFDEEDEFRRHGDWYMRKSFAMEGEAPEIRVETASGTAALRK